MTKRGRKDKPAVAEDDEVTSLGAAMRRTRQQHDVSLSDLANRLGYTVGWLSGVENAKGIPARELVEAYEREFELPAGELTDLWQRQQGALGRRGTVSRPTATLSTGTLPSTSQPQRQGFRFGSNYALVPATRADQLRDIREQLAILQHDVAHILSLVDDLAQQEDADD